MKSIMHDKDGTCYLCVLLHQNSSPRKTQEHHVIFGTANRKQSEKYGLKVHLCLEHHEHGKEAVHMNAQIALILKKEAQKCFERTYPNLSFLEIFGKNYLDDGDREVESIKRQQFSFQIIEDGVEPIDWG